MQVQKENTIGEVVASNFKTAQVFEKYGLDFCCGGKKTISDACAKNGVDTDKLINELLKLNNNGNGKSNDYASWEPDFLVDYIINNHHSYVVKTLPVIYAHSRKVAGAHGENHPEVIKIAEYFSMIKDELEAHLMKEEKMLFPYIKKLAEIKKKNLDVQYPPFGSVKEPIRVMEAEHENAGTLMSEINTLSRGYNPPEDACTTFRVLYQELKEFEDDLHVHIHLENNILHPKAIELENILNKNLSI
ncbi:MAG: iron-sulfur cluster repair di-iron protein [Ignavibacteriae bacterium]|nr:MAG: iron-sulfur cluster repair di-iron protein [Ignavibacteriota bacterium]